MKIISQTSHLATFGVIQGQAYIQSQRARKTQFELLSVESRYTDGNQ